MEEKKMRLFRLRWWLVLATPLVICLTFFLIERFALVDEAPEHPLNANLNELQKAIVELNTELAKLYITSALGILAVTAYYLKEREGFASIRGSALVSLWGSSATAILSIYFGHVWLTGMRNQLEADYLNSLSATQIWPENLQYLTLLLSLSWFALLVIERELVGRTKTGERDE